MPTTDQATNQQQKQTIEELTKRYNTLNTKKIEAEANLKTAQKALEKLQEEAKKKFGTDDVQQLKDKLAEMEDSNEKARSKYQISLDAIEAALAKVEDDLKSDEVGPKT